jgi:hypothetical protein
MEEEQKDFFVQEDQRWANVKQQARRMQQLVHMVRSLVHNVHKGRKVIESRPSRKKLIYYSSRHKKNSGVRVQSLLVSMSS